MPVKFLEVYFIATGNWFGTIVTLVLAKLLGLGVTAFVVDATRDKLLQIPWFHRMYDWFIWALDWAYTQKLTDPRSKNPLDVQARARPVPAARASASL